MTYSPVPGGDQVWPAAGVVVAALALLGGALRRGWRSAQGYLDTRFDRLDAHNRATRKIAKKALRRADDAHVRLDRRAGDNNVS